MSPRRPGTPYPPDAHPAHQPPEEKLPPDDLPTIDTLPTVEHKDAEPVRREVEYVDAEGKRIGVAHIALSAEQVGMEFTSKKDDAPTMGRRLESFILVGELDGKEVEVDVLEIANPHGIEIHVADDYLKNYNYRDKDNLAICPPLNTPLDVGVLLHELGHADQYRHARIGKLAPIYSAETRFGASKGQGPHVSEILRVLDGTIDAIPNIEKFVDKEAVEQLKKLEERRIAQMDRVREIDGQINGLDREQERIYRGHVVERLSKRMALDTFFERLVEADENIEDHPDDAGLADTHKEDFMKELEGAGFRLSEEEHEPEWDVLGGKEAHELPLLPRSAIEDLSRISQIVQSATSRLSVLTSSMRHDGDRSVLTVSIELTTEDLRGYRLDVELDMDEKDHDMFSEELDELEKHVTSLEKEAARWRRLSSGAEHAQKIVYEGSTLPDIVAVPTKIMERDATSRAMRWMRQIRDQSGADLTKRHSVKVESMVVTPGHAESCTDSTTRGMEDPNGNLDPVTSSFEDLSRALETYGAGKSWKLRKPNAEDGI